MISCVRTTPTLDDDLAKLLLRAQQCREASLKAVVTEALRHGLLRMATPATPRRSSGLGV